MVALKSTKPTSIISQRTGRLPVLTYHSLDDSGSVVSVSPDSFCRQMEYLSANGWRSLTLAQMLDGYARGEWPTRSFLLTFDDGFVNFAEYAFPVLTACGFSATVFVAPDWVGRSNDWPGQPRWVPRLPLMDWNALRRIAAVGIEIGGHSLSHSHLNALPVVESEREVHQCRQVIEERIGSAVRAFAYPYGEGARDLEQVVAQYYDAGFGTRLGYATATSRRHEFERIDMFYLRHPRFFRALETGWLGSYLKVRHWIRFLRQSASHQSEGNMA